MKQSAELISLISGLAMAASLGCTSKQQAANQPDTAQQPQPYSEIRQSELESERQEFIDETEQRLTELENEIDRMQARVEHEGQHVDASQRAEWSQDLFELKQDKARLSAELERARNANEREWAEMRGNLGRWVDSLQAAVTRAGSELNRAFTADEPPMTSGLCAVQVPGADADVEQRQNEVIVTVTTDEESSVDMLRRRAREMSQNMTEYRPATAATPGHAAAGQGATQESEAAHSPGSPGSEQMVPASGEVDSASEQPLKVTTRLEEVEDGVRIAFTSTNNETQRLRDSLESDADALEEGRCVSMGAQTSMR